MNAPAPGSPQEDPQAHNPPPAGPPGYGAPGPGAPGYGPPGYGGPGYGPPGAAPQGYGPQGYGPKGPSDDNLWALLSYILALVASIIAPLVIYLVKMNESRYVRYHAAQALNMGITAFISLFALFIVIIPVAIFTHGIGFLLLFPLFFGWMIAHLVFLIIAAVRANRGELYQVPWIMCLRMVR